MPFDPSTVFSEAALILGGVRIVIFLALLGLGAHNPPRSLSGMAAGNYRRPVGITTAGANEAHARFLFALPQ